ncbi:MAG: Crp/Fnr family transcriptional regulator [Terracidiphilus sp.]|jgi:CRP/FNR family cyclic AMP-dependent transcriptional regulator
MRALQLIHRQARTEFQADRNEGHFARRTAEAGEMPILTEFPIPRPFRAMRDDACGPRAAEGFFQDLSAEAQSEFQSLATDFRCSGLTVLINEADQPSSILFLLEGEVNISMNSSDGRRFLLGVAGAGDILGLTSAISGDFSEIRVQAMYPCRIASMRRRDFLRFLSRHPIASQNVARELCVELTRARERLRILGLTSSAMARVAHLLLEWCKMGQRIRDGVQIRCALTHREIGECIGASRETVTRALADFRARDLVRLHGSTLVVTSCGALAAYAGIDSIPDLPRPAA